MTKNNILDTHRLQFLVDKIRKNIASKSEKDEYMLILFKNGSITQKQYQDFLNDKNTEDIINAAVAIGAIILLGYLLSKLFDP